MKDANQAGEARGGKGTAAGRRLRQLFRREEGATLTEYALLLCLIALGCILAMTSIGGSVANMFRNTAAVLRSVGP